jgi:hypothetical protein
MRVQQRKVKVKPQDMELPARPKTSSKGFFALAEKFIDGHSSETIWHYGKYILGFQILLLIIGMGLLFIFSDAPLKIEAVLFFLLALIVPGVFVWPALKLASDDKKAEPTLVQGQLIQASPISLVYGLGLLILNTRNGKVQYNVERKFLKNIPQAAQTQIALRVSPKLRHVTNVQVIGKRPMGIGNIQTELPEQFKSAERFPIVTMLLSYGSVFGLGLIFLLVPLYGGLLWIHLVLVPLSMVLVGVAIRPITKHYQKKLEASLQENVD